jgi:hypothetical protein
VVPGRDSRERLSTSAPFIDERKGEESSTCEHQTPLGIDSSWLGISRSFVDQNLVAKAVTNLLGLRYTFLLGRFGCVFYIDSLWGFQTQWTKCFVYIGGSVLETCASLLWSARELDVGAGHVGMERD